MKITKTSATFALLTAAALGGFALYAQLRWQASVETRLTAASLTRPAAPETPARQTDVQNRVGARDGRSVLSTRPAFDAATSQTITARLDTFESTLGKVEAMALNNAALLEQLREMVPAPAVGSPNPSFDSDAVLDEARRAEVPADLSERHVTEAELSEWGAQVAANLDIGYQSESANNPFFLEHGAIISSDCRETVCRVDLRMAELESGLNDQTRFELLHRAELELLGLAGYAEGVGRVSTDYDPAADPPTVSLFMQQEEQSGGDATTWLNSKLLTPLPKGLE